MESLLTIENNLEPWLRRMNLRTGPILAIPIHFLLRAHASIGPDTTLSRLCSLQPDFGLRADWLLEQCHRIWLAVKITGSWKCLILPRLADSTENTSWMIRRQRREGFCCLILLFCGLVVGKYTLICAMEIQKIQIVVHIFQLRICFIYRTNVSKSRSWIPLQFVDREQDAFCIAVKGIFVGIILKASAASLKVTDLLFSFAFCKQ